MKMRRVLVLLALASLLAVAWSAAVEREVTLPARIAEEFVDEPVHLIFSAPMPECETGMWLVVERVPVCSTIEEVKTHLRRERTKRIVERARAKAPRDVIEIAGIIPESGEMMLEHRRADGIRQADAFARGRGVAVTAKRRDGSNRPAGATDSQAECEEKTESMCKEAGHGGIKKSTAEITTHENGCKTCSAECEKNGAVAFVTEANCG